ncbi:hypothetical protein B296_00054355, partial [Ensete ventricosum]
MVPYQYRQYVGTPVWFTISIYTVWYGRYIPIRQVTGTRTARYRTILPKIDHRQPIEGEIDVGDRLREKSGRLREKREEEEEKKKKEEEEKKGRKKYLAPSSPVGRPRAVATLVSFFSRARRRNVSEA